jgi:hypothetical protein
VNADGADDILTTPAGPVPHVKVFDGPSLGLLNSSFVIPRQAVESSSQAAADRREKSRLCFVVVSKATRQLEGAINLTLFDDSEAIRREIETVIAGVK